MDVAVKSPAKKAKMWKRIKSSFRPTKQKRKSLGNINISMSPSESPNNLSVPPLPPSSSTPKLQADDSSSVSSLLPFMNSSGKSLRKKDLSNSDLDDKVILVGKHKTTDRITITSTSTSTPSKEVQPLKQKVATEQSISVSKEARDNHSTITEASLCVVSRLCVEQCTADSNNSALWQNSVMLELEVKRAMVEISSDTMDEADIVKRLRDTIQVLEADAVVNRNHCKQQEERVIEWKLIVEKLKGKEENLKQVLCDNRIQTEKLSKALQDKNKELFKLLANVSEKLYKKQHVRRLELTAKVLAEQLARVRAEGDSPAENFSPRSDGNYSPRVSGSRKAGYLTSPVVSPWKEAKVKKDLEQKKREALDIKLKFFEKEMEVSRLKSILEKGSRSQPSKKVSGFGEAAFKQHQLADTISEGGPYELPVDHTKNDLSPRRGVQQNSPGGSRPRSNSMTRKKESRKQRMYISPKRKTITSKAWKT